MVELHLLADKDDQRLCEGEDPLVHHVALGQQLVLDRHERLASLLLVDFDVLVEEAERVVPRKEHLGNQLLDALLLEAEVIAAHHRGVDQVKTECVRTIGVGHEERIGVVSETLAHLSAVRGKDEAVDDQMAVRGVVEQRSPQNEERVEPPTGLVNALGDKVGREASLKDFLVLERVVKLGIWHGARLEPAVKHLEDAMERLASLLRGDGEVVDALAMQIGNLLSGEFFELLN